MPGTYISPAETELYYLQSRYYDPSLGRFINADSYVSTGQGILGNNMFAYCRNNPVSRKDAAGTDDVSCTTEEDNNPFNDLGKAPGQGSGGGAGGGNSFRNISSASGSTNKGGYVNAANLIDQGYHYGNSYTSNSYHTNPNTSNAIPSSQQNNPLTNITYTDKVKGQLQNSDFHSFPLLVDNYGSYGEMTYIAGGDGNIYNRLRIPGSYSGYDGYFEYIWDSNGVCNHRFFIKME